jgi:hypothetical protein
LKSAHDSELKGAFSQGNCRVEGRTNTGVDCSGEEGGRGPCCLPTEFSSGVVRARTYLGDVPRAFARPRSCGCTASERIWFQEDYCPSEVGAGPLYFGGRTVVAGNSGAGGASSPSDGAGGRGKGARDELGAEGEAESNR